MTDKDLLKKAKKRVKARKEFNIHLITFICTMPFLFLINWLTSPNFWWAFFPLGGWGLGLIMHYVTQFGFFGLNSPDWEKRALEKEMDRLIKEEDPDFLENSLPLPEDRLELKEKLKLDKDWDEKDLV